MTFNIATLPQSPQAENQKLTVWTRDGIATKEVQIIGERRQGKPLIEEVFPLEVDVSDPRPIFVVKGKNLKNLRSVQLATLKSKQYTEIGPRNGTRIEAIFNQIRSTAGTLTKLELIVTTAEGVAKKDVTVKHPSGGQSQPASAKGGKTKPAE